MDKNMKFGLIVFISIIALFVLSLWISQTPNDVDNSVRFGILTLIPPLVAIGLAFFNQTNDNILVCRCVYRRIHAKC
jgi:hypothetical protein